MGLDDLVPDDKQSSSSSSSSRPRDSDDSPDKVEIGGEPYKKVFTEERWEKVKKVIGREMGLDVNKVVNNYPANERYEIIHEAALAVGGELEPDELDNYRDERCEICGIAKSEASVTICGDVVCVSHSAGQVAVMLDDDK